MTPAIRTAARTAHLKTLASTVGLWLAAPLAHAHTGHGHDDFSTLEGTLHALSEPDHLAMLVAGITLTGWLAPRVLRGLQRAFAALRRRVATFFAERRGTAR